MEVLNMALTKEQNDLMSKLLKLDTLAYFPEFSSEKYRTVGDFISAFRTLKELT